jgi:hypothetical protein
MSLCTGPYGGPRGGVCCERGTRVPLEAWQHGRQRARVSYEQSTLLTAVSDERGTPVTREAWQHGWQRARVSDERGTPVTAVSYKRGIPVTLEACSMCGSASA